MSDELSILAILKSVIAKLLGERIMPKSKILYLILFYHIVSYSHLFK